MACQGFSHPHQHCFITWVHLWLVIWKNFSGHQKQWWEMVWTAAACCINTLGHLIVLQLKLFWDTLWLTNGISETVMQRRGKQSHSHFAHRSCGARCSNWCWLSHYLNLKRPLIPSKENMCALISSEAAVLDCGHASQQFVPSFYFWKNTVYDT